MKRIIAFILVIGMVLLCIGIASADDLEDLRKQQDQIQQLMQQEKAALDKAQKECNTLTERIKYIEDQIAAAEKELAVIEANLEEARQLVLEAKEDLARIEDELQKKVELFKQRLKQIYQQGDVNLFEVLTQSTSLTDFLVRFELLKKIAEQDMIIVEEIDRQRILADEKKQELEAKRDQVALLKQQSEAKMAQLTVQKEEQHAFLVEVNQEKAVAQQAIKELDADSIKLGAKIREIQLSRAREGLEAPTGKFHWPTPGHTRITSDYGMRKHPILGTRSMHTGVDIAAPMGSPAVAGEVGEVIFTGWFGAYGWTVVLDHGGGISSMYPHLSKITVEENQIVTRGEEVGKVGTSGLSTGPHIHFEIRKDGTPIDPWPYLK